MLRSAGIYFATRVLAAMFALLAVAVFTRLVPPETYGVYTLVMSTAIGIFAVAYQWLRASVLRFVPGKNGMPRATLEAALAGYLVVSIALTLIVAIAVAIGLVSIDGAILALAVAITLLYAAMEIVLACWQAKKKPVIYAVLTLGRAGGVLVISAGLALAGFGAVGLLAGALLANALPLLVARLFFAARLPELHFDRTHLRTIASFGLPLGLVGIGGTIIGLSDRYLIAWLIGVDAAGAYAAPYDLAQRSLSVLMLSAFLAYSPHVFGSWADDEHDKCHEAIRAQLSLSLAFSLPVAIVMAAASPLVSSILFGEAFHESAASVLPWIVLASLLQGIQSYYISYGFTLPKRAGTNAAIVIGGALLNLPLNLLLIPPFGIVGAAIATIASYATVLAVSIMVTRRWIHLPWPAGDTVRVILSCLAALPFVLIAGRSTSILHGLLWLVPAGAVILALYAASDTFGLRTRVLGALERARAHNAPERE